MVFCSKCGNKINKDDKFCQKCGKINSENKSHSKNEDSNIFLNFNYRKISFISFLLSILIIILFIFLIIISEGFNIKISGVFFAILFYLFMPIFILSSIIFCITHFIMKKNKDYKYKENLFTLTNTHKFSIIIILLLVLGSIVYINMNSNLKREKYDACVYRCNSNANLCLADCQRSHFYTSDPEYYPCQNTCNENQRNCLGLCK